MTILRDATTGQLLQAVAQNHRELFCLEAIAGGGEVKTSGGLIYTYSGPANSAAVAFPALEEQGSGALLDEMLDYYRAHPPNNIGYWSLHPPQPEDIGIKLLARGFQPGWRPCWMALDLDKLKEERHGPSSLRIEEDNTTNIEAVKDLPYAANNNMASAAFRKAWPGRVQRFIASIHGKMIGQSCVFFTTGEYGVAGLYNVGVVPEARNQGIGKALTLAACRYAQQHGYRYAVLNASEAGRPVYKKTGFEWMGDGLSWWITSNWYIALPPSPQQVSMAEATGRGDIAALDALGNRLTIAELNTALTNGMTLVELAVHFRQPASAEWLLAHGVAYTVLDAWDIGWKDRANALLAARPHEVNRQYGEGRLTLLHIAAQRNDVELAAMALSAKPDLSITDPTHHSTALGWATHFRREEIVRMIRQQGVAH